ncbi:VOC family protein [Kibdelosporangium aridum]|uniref:Glyoxalase-like domain-containing protein n=1 Tax=Kibdelosporangium aridum TaxID=2030 RepID=A0A1W2EAZ1_KIBAR|nr:VOC family protein [Kibdelosporangium aridum]SMD06218.1 Glyoxalase-like domain-containing protein [Kibdelosporangium aridum]
MTIRRVVPDVRSADIGASTKFYGLLGFEEVMNHGWVVGLASPSNPTAQVLLTDADPSGLQPDMSVEVSDVDAVHAVLVDQGADIVYAIRDEPWGVRRFFVRDPDGHIVNVLTHR